ncbi:hypothetical protein [Pantoea sp. OXWO6B1]|uniref:hypothetical protein n=1 Tax=Pantoea TaxID=53335 RepID=UPI000A49E52E|nr:hypothetical protein [Pantoea sp. OXWO6B1]
MKQMIPDWACKKLWVHEIAIKTFFCTMEVRHEAIHKERDGMLHAYLLTPIRKKYGAKRNFYFELVRFEILKECFFASVCLTATGIFAERSIKSVTGGRFVICSVGRGDAAASQRTAFAGGSSGIK